MYLVRNWQYYVHADHRMITAQQRAAHRATVREDLARRCTLKTQNMRASNTWNYVQESLAPTIPTKINK